MFSKQICF
uniref:Uncharacterized protein n=1 Tax=Arundo donax TaxID=35708 RepID=A0A0A8YZE7_ARUDO